MGWEKSGRSPQGGTERGRQGGSVAGASQARREALREAGEMGTGQMGPEGLARC